MCLTIDPVVLICEVRWSRVLVSFVAVHVFGYCSSVTSLPLVLMMLVLPVHACVRFVHVRVT